MTRDEIIASAEKYLAMKIPFLHQGRDPAIGLDCVGYVQAVANDFHIPFDDMIGYGRAPHNSDFLRHLQKYTNPQPITANKHGLIGVFRQNVYPCHIGIFSVDADGTTWVLNARADQRKVVKNLWEPNDLVLVQLRSFPGMVE